MRDSLRFTFSLLTFAVCEHDPDKVTGVIHTGGPEEGMLGEKATNFNIYLEIRSHLQFNIISLLPVPAFYLCSKMCALDLVRQFQWCYITGPRGNVSVYMSRLGFQGG